MKTTVHPIVLYAGAILAIILCLSLLIGSQKVGASAPPGIAASIATSSNPTIAAVTSTLLFSTSTCATRVITTYASPVMLTFSDNQGLTPSGIFGHLQPASTTVAYDATQYGCGAVKVFSFVAQLLTVSESR